MLEYLDLGTYKKRTYDVTSKTCLDTDSPIVLGKDFRNNFPG